MATITDDSKYQRPPWPAAVAALLAYAALALSSGAVLPLLGLGVGLAASYAFAARYENATLTKWTLRLVVYSLTIFGYLIYAVKDENAFLDVRYVNSFALAAAAEVLLQFWRREPTGGARAPFTVFLSAMVFLIGCSILDETRHYLWFLAPAFFLFFALALPGFQSRAKIPLRYAAPPILFALLLGGLTHAGFYRYKNELNLLGVQSGGNRRMSASMGMSGQPILGSSFTLQDSLTRVLRIHNLGTDAYLRGMTFDTYSGHTWGPTLDQRVFLAYHPPSAAIVPGKQTARFIRLDDANGLLFMPLHAAAIAAEGGAPLEWAVRTDGPLRTLPTLTDSLTYDVVQAADKASPEQMDAPPTPQERARDLTVPSEVDPRVAQKARLVAGPQKSASEKVNAIVHFLRANNSYSLTVNPGSGEPVSNFILQRKSAHCEYFASAAVLMLRAVGIPTRYVSGYFAYESDGRNWTLVRQRDAHAWAESWVNGGWVTVDATPGSGRPDALAGPIPWYWHVWEAAQDALGFVRNWLVTASWAAKGSVFFLLVLGLLVPQVYRWRQRRAGPPEFRYSSPDAALALLAVRFEALLARRGFPCPEGRTWREHLRGTELESDPEMVRFVEDYSQARFGPPLNQRDIASLSADLRELEKQGLEKKVLEKV